MKRLACIAVVCFAAAALAGLVHAYFDAPAADGTGLAAGATVAAGAAPQAVAGGGRQVTLAWPASQLSNGRVADGYLLRRYDASTHAEASVLPDCAGTVTATHCVENDLPPGSWVWTVTPVVGTNWRGAESGDSNAVNVDPPSLAVEPAVLNLASFADGAATLDATLTGFAANESLSMTFDEATGPAVAFAPTRVDEAGHAEIRAQLPRAADGPHVLFATGASSPFRSRAGATVTIDTVAPLTSADADDDWHRTAVTVHLHADDPAPGTGVVGISSRVDGGPTVDSQRAAADVLVPDDGVHVVAFAATDGAGNREAERQVVVRVDTTAPSTELTTAPSAPDGSNGWFRQPSVSVSLTASDVTSGVAHTHYSVDGGATVAYDGPFALAGEGPHTVVYWSTDRAGNDEAPLTSHVDLDSVDPKTRLQADPPIPDGVSGWYRSAPSFTVAALDATSGLAGAFYRIDDDASAPYSGVVSLGDGVHAVEYWSRDNAGNESALQTASVKVDTEAPATAIAYLPGAPDGANGWYSSATRFTLAAVDTVSGVERTVYAVDSGPPQTYSGAVTLADGRHTIRYWSIDNAGNAEAAHTSDEIDVDTVEPSVTASISPSVPDGTNGWYRTTPTVSLAASDDTSGVASILYRLDGGTTETYADGIAVPDGHHTVTFWAVDDAGNAADEQTTASIDVDTVDPTAALGLGPSPTDAVLSGDTLFYKNAANGSFHLVATVTDATSGPAAADFPALTATGWTHAAETVASPADGPYQSGTFQFAGGAQAPGAYTVTVTDAAGNRSTFTIVFVLVT
jgi:hypothetical protein